MTNLDESRIRYLRLQAQRLANDTRLPSATEVVKAVCGIQAQDAQAAILSVRVRSTGLTHADTESALLRDRTIIRTWAMRGTLHLVATDDLPWLLGLLGPIFAASDRRRRLQLGLDDATATRAVEVIHEALAARGPQTRAELLQTLTEKGIRADGQGVIHLIALAALQGLLCLGPDRGNKPTYVRLTDWNKDAVRPSSLSREAACDELARRYLSAYSPVKPEDFAFWSGVPMGDVRAAWQRLDSRQEIAQLDSTIGPLWLLNARSDWRDKTQGNVPDIRLLPAFDTFWMGYRSRDLMLSPQYARRINAGGGILHPALLLEGHAEGTWKILRRKNQIEIAVNPFELLTPEALPGLQAEAADVGRFLGIDSMLRVDA